jgi:hypothetical protein
VLDKMMPRQDHDAISTLLEFEDAYQYANIEEEIDDFLKEGEAENPTSVKSTLKVAKLIKQNIVKLRKKCMDIA